MASHTEINRYLAQRLDDENLDEIDLITAANWLNEQGVLKDSSQRPGLPLRKLLRAGKIYGAYQHPNRRWIIRQSHKETTYSVREAASELGVTEHAIYKRIERGLIKPEKLGLKSLVIPQSELIRAQQDRINETQTNNTGEYQDHLSTIKKQLLLIQNDLEQVINKVENLVPSSNIQDQSPAFSAIEDLERKGFEGFVSLDSYQQGQATPAPEEKGIYLVLDPSGNPPVFKKRSRAGHFKGNNPTVDTEVLKKKWVNNTILVYIGQAGAGSSSATLKSRIRQLVAFGSGKPISHWEGRYLWQLKDSGNLVLCWQTTPNNDPYTLENELLHTFSSHYGTLPFANLMD